MPRSHFLWTSHLLWIYPLVTPVSQVRTFASQHTYLTSDPTGASTPA